MENEQITTLQQAIVHFADPQNCLAYLAKKRWPNGVVVCPTCGGTKVSFLKKQLRWQCASHHPKRQFSVKVGTIFEDSPLGLDKWLPAMWLITNAKNGISSWEVHRALGVSQKTAWFMLHRIRLSHQPKHGNKLSGQIEADETYIGGKARNMHASVRARKVTGTGGKDKTAVLGILERGGKVRTKVIDNTKKKTLQREVREHVLAGSALFTDALQSYEGLDEFQHEVVDHAVEYVRGEVHTNGLENFWSLLKRSIKGTYVSVEPFHLFRYLDEQAFRYNNRRDMNDWDRFDLAVSGIVGKRVHWQDRAVGSGNDAILRVCRVVRRSGRFDLSFRPAPVGVGVHLLAIRALAALYERVRDCQHGIDQRIEALECLRSLVALWQWHCWFRIHNASLSSWHTRPSIG